uniref:Major facilitator superfamily (MFS) profile domain-containing protein n=1 Tax=Globodera rostochiensis TaxID=31243 RepID=A0A914HMU9_GLORO
MQSVVFFASGTKSNGKQLCLGEMHQFQLEKFDLRLFLACFLLAVGTNFFEAFSASYPSSANHSFHTFFNNSYIDRGHSAGVGHLVLKCFWTLSLHVAPFGNLIGCLLGPICTEKYGRRGSLLLANLYGFVASLISIGSIMFEFPELLILGRLVASASATVGLLALVLFLQEIPSCAERGLYSFLCALSVSVVECFALCLNLALPQLGERLLVLVGIPVVPQIAALLVALQLMETPQFLAMVTKNKREKALRAFAFYRKGFSGPEAQEELDKMCPASEDCDQFCCKTMICQFFARSERWKAVLIGFCTLQITVGGWPVLESSTEILSEHFCLSVVEVASYVLVVVYFLSSLTGLFFVERLNRRPLIIRSAVLNTFFLCLYIAFHWSSMHLGHWMGWLCLPCIFLFAISLGFALGPLSYFLCAELLPHPSAHSAWFISLVFGANIASTYIFDWATPPLFRKASAWAFVPLYILPSLCCLVPLWLYLPETRDRTMKDIVNELKKGEQKQSNGTTSSTAQIQIESH